MIRALSIILLLALSVGFAAAPGAVSADILGEISGSDHSAVQSGAQDCAGCPGNTTRDFSQCKGGCTVPCSIAARLALLPAAGLPVFVPGFRFAVRPEPALWADKTSLPPDPSPPKA